MREVFTERLGFPCGEIPAGSAARLLGLYEQRQEGLWMQRIRVPAGRLAGEQWRAMAALARDFGGGEAHLTTRQELELHGLAAEQVPEVQARLAAAGLSGVCACGDSVRNVIVCPCQAARPGGVDLERLGERLVERLFAVEGIFALPRKFKISLSCEREGCPGQPFIHDLGLVLRERDGQWGLRVVAGGSLGGRPNLGVEVSEWIAAEEAFAMAAGVAAVFAEHGDRENRRRARLRYVRERVGDERFVEMVREAFGGALREHGVEAVERTAAGPGREWAAVLRFVTGQVSAAGLEALGAVADTEGMAVRIGTHHAVWVFGPGREDVERAVGGQAALVEAGRPGAHVVACPGTRTCRHGLVDTWAAARRIAAELGPAGAGLTVCISGCPNGCGQSGVGPVGLFGVKAGGAEAFDVWTGGEMGRSRRAGEVRHKRVPSGDVAEVVRREVQELEKG